MNKDFNIVKNKLENDSWQAELTSEFYIKDIERYIIGNVELSIVDKLQELVSERKRIFLREEQNEISNYNNLIVEIRLKQLNIYITQFQQEITIILPQTIHTTIYKI